MFTRHLSRTFNTSLFPARVSNHIHPQHHVIPLIKHQHPTRLIFATSFTMSPSAQEKDRAKQSGHKDADIEGEKNEWKFREPYKVHENDPNFKALYEGSCHCGRIQYQLSREKPLDAKYCHCSTCQVLHGMLNSLSINLLGYLMIIHRSTIPVGSNFSQIRYQLHPWTS